MANIVIVSNIEEAITEILKQLKEKDFYMHNYTILDGCQEYLDISEKQCEEAGVEFDEVEQLYNYLAYDLKWDDDDSIFPMKLQ